MIARGTGRPPTKILVGICTLWMLASRPSGAQDLPAENPSKLVLRVSPERLVLDRPGEAVVEITLTGPILSEGSEPRLHLQVNTGTLSEVRSKGPGAWAASYRPPSASFPQVALFLAVARGERTVVPGWAALPMSGVGDALVESKPRSLVRIRIEDAEFGPVMTDKKGSARIPLVVAPGVRTGTSEGKEIPLNVPPFNRVAAIAERGEMRVGPGQQTRIWVVAVDPWGVPARELPLEAAVSRGQVSSPRFLGDGLANLDYTPPLTEGAGEDTVSVRIPGEPASRASLRFGLLSPPRPPPPPAAPAPAIAAPSPKRFSLAPEVGVITNLSQLHAPAALIDLLWNPAFLPPEWVLHLEVGAYFSKLDGELQGQEVGSFLTVVPLALSLSYRYQVGERWFFLGRVGGGIYGMWHSLEQEGESGIQRSALNLGADIGLGGGLALSPGKLLLEVRYLYLESKGIAELRGHLGGLCMLMGYQFSLF